jgi:hypothetical protein
MFRVMAIQYETGNQATEFDSEYAANGVIVSTFDLAIPGVERGQLSTLNHIPRIVGIGADVTHASVGDTVVTSHSVVARSKHKDHDKYSEWTDDVSKLAIPKGGNGTVQIGTILATQDLNETPILHSHYLDFERVPVGSFNGVTVGSFCRGDGTEFDGTALCYDVPILDRDKPILEEDFADSTKGLAVMGKETNWLHGFAVEMFLQHSAEEAVQLIGEGLDVDEDQDEDASLFELWVQGRKYRVRITSLDFSVARETYIPIPGLENMGRFLFRAEAIEGEVIEMEAL